jgi:putative membrane protein
MYARPEGGKPVLGLVLGAVILMAMPAIIQAQEQPNQPPTSTSDPASTRGPATSGANLDQKFVTDAADGGMAEVELGRLAAEKASSSEVKQFGQRMVADHSKANDQLKQIAANKGLTLPTQPSPKNRAKQERLSKLSGDAFDKAYMADMLKDHKEDVADFEKESTAGKDPEIRQFAAEALPTLQDHLKQAQSISDGGRGTSSGASSPQPQR